MAILNEGLNKVRDLLKANLTKGQNGTGTTTVSAGDSGLDTADASTLKTLTSSVADRLLTTRHTLLTTDANGDVLTEFENQFSTGESMIRIRHTPITKNNVKQLDFIVTYNLEGD